MGKNTGFIDGWKLYANFFDSIPLRLRFYICCLYELSFFLRALSSFFINFQSSFSINLQGYPCFNSVFVYLNSFFSCLLNFYLVWIIGSLSSSFLFFFPFSYNYLMRKSKSSISPPKSLWTKGLCYLGSFCSLCSIILKGLL